jgi:hypothetical protein
LDSKALWKALNKKFKVDVVVMKKFIIDKFLDFKKVHSIIIMSQIQEFQLTFHYSYAKDMIITSFQMVAIIGKLPPSWKEFKNYFKHKSKKTGVEDLVLRLRVEKENKLSKKELSLLI